MRVIAKSTLRDFWLRNADCEQALKSWYHEADKSSWKQPNDIKLEYPSASILADNRVGFNIIENSYRLIVKVNYACHIIWVRFIHMLNMTKSMLKKFKK